MSRHGDPFADGVGFLVALFFVCLAGGFIGAALAFWMSPCLGVTP